MNDYKELIAELRKLQTLGDAPVGNGFGVIVDKLTLKQAADAIEQLCTDVARVGAENYSKEQYIAETIGKLARERKRDDEIIASLQKELVEAAKERDAAIADLKVNWLCAVCKKRVVTREWMRCDSKDFYEAPCEAPTCLNFEWRGVQEVEHEETPT